MRSVVLLWLGLLSGCSSLPSTPATVSRPAQAESASFALNGRIAVRHNGERNSAGVRWTHTTQSDEVLLMNPLGQTAVRVYRDGTGASLEDGEKRYRAEDAESLMQQVLGWQLPLSGLHHWVLGLAAAGSPAQIERDANGRITVLRQDGWEVRYLRHADDKPDSLPMRLQLSREGLQIQLPIDEWEIR